MRHFYISFKHCTMCPQDLLSVLKTIELPAGVGLELPGEWIEEYYSQVVDCRMNVHGVVNPVDSPPLRHLDRLNESQRQELFQCYEQVFVRGDLLNTRYYALELMQNSSTMAAQNTREAAALFSRSLLAAT